MYCQGDAQGIPCSKTNYDRFDIVCKKELSLDITLNDIINESDFCTSIPIAFIKETKDINDDLSFTRLELIRGLKGSMGIYHIWMDIAYCDNHENFLLVCVYVGKGIVHERVLTHLKDKFQDVSKIYISFYSCENRIAKYLEQLCLDTYHFVLNTEENKKGDGKLYAKWDKERYDLGTESDSYVDMIEDKLRN